LANKYGKLLLVDFPSTTSLKGQRVWVYYSLFTFVFSVYFTEIPQYSCSIRTCVAILSIDEYKKINKKVENPFDL